MLILSSFRFLSWWFFLPFYPLISLHLKVFKRFATETKKKERKKPHSNHICHHSMLYRQLKQWIQFDVYFLFCSLHRAAYYSHFLYYWYAYIFPVFTTLMMEWRALNSCAHFGVFILIICTTFAGSKLIFKCGYYNFHMQKWMAATASVPAPAKITHCFRSDDLLPPTPLVAFVVAVVYFFSNVTCMWFLFRILRNSTFL